MISVYRGSDYFEAQLLRDLIEQAGLQVFLHGASLQGGLGEIRLMRQILWRLMNVVTLCWKANNDQSN
jgi:hypothetical protein